MTTKTTDLPARDLPGACTSIETETATASGNTCKLKDYSLLKLVGAGSFGEVWLSCSKKDGAACAVKVVRKARLVKDPTLISGVNQEVDTLKRLGAKSPYIVNLHNAFANSEYLFMVLDFAQGGDLFTLIGKFSKLPENLAKLYVAELSCALEHLHNNSIIHRDLKPENVLITHDGHVKLVDFGLSKRIRYRTGTRCGTLLFQAPEIRRGNLYTFAVDWWALGVVTCEMLTGNLPFGCREPGVPSEILLDHYEIPGKVSSRAAKFLKSLLSIDPMDRPGCCEEISSQSWMQTEIDWLAVEKGTAISPYCPKLSGPWDASCFLNIDQKPNYEDLSKKSESFRDQFPAFY
ncbi:hypothetical protein CROQUDRAFT_716225 [Cronartium quercuum f. sp. fusiforme G11]|uniref:Protein kinase domain-containing protein n=1 Tax=Cronartium quercuum f. sp. fusiforme G11 TaxID=708437 RepID=A0A9P6NJA4_9BASI|nr:hypothetical protein CROQUDRAFT_716225 [Cronartium quercuum f. sp. fusiforme G11]